MVECTGQSHARLLAAGKAEASFSDHRVDAIREGGNFLVHLDGFKDSIEIAGLSEADVVLDCSREKLGAVTHVADRADGVDFASKALSTVKDRAFIRVLAEERAAQRRFPAGDFPCDADEFPGLGFEVEIFVNRVVAARVGEGNVANGKSGRRGHLLFCLLDILQVGTDADP